MAHTNSPLGQLSGVVPSTTDPPDIQGDLELLIGEAEKKLVMSFATRTARNAAIVSPVDGMTTYIEDVDEVDMRIAGAWTKIWPIRYYGTGDPSSGVGVTGDMYFKYT